MINNKINIVRFRKKLKKTTWITARGISMLPIIPEKSKIKIFPQNKYYIGDIIVFIQKKTLYVHRIVFIKREKDNKYFITKGDNAISLDDRIKKSQIMGKVLKVKNEFFQKNIKLNLLSMLVSVISYISGKFFNYYKRTNRSLLKKIFRLINRTTKKINYIILYLTLIPTFFKNKYFS